MGSVLKYTRVKICGLTRARDVREAAACGADAIGFVFVTGSRRFLDLPTAGELAGLVPAFVARVGLFLDQEAQEVRDVLEQVPLSLLQFHGREDAAYCRQFGLPYIKAVSMNSEHAIQQAEAEYTDAAALLLDSHEPGGLGGTGQVFDWSQVRRSERPLILAGGLTPDNVREAVRQSKPWGVDVSSGVEDAPGIKNTGAMRRFIEEAKSEYPCE